MNLNEMMTLAYNDKIFLSLQNEEDCIKYIRPDDASIGKKWNNSNYTDFSIYQDMEYFSQLFICYVYVSRGAIFNMLKFFKSKISNYKNLTYFDDYNGVGLTTLHLLQESLNVEIFNDNSSQLNIFYEYCDQMKLKRPINIINKENKQYDVVLSFEVVEHYRTPINDYINPLIQMIKPNGYLVYTSGFHNVRPGHFPDYNIFGKTYEIREAGYEVEDYLDNYFNKLYIGQKDRPIIYKKR